ncbi:MAG TPA: hypothetical protein VE379_07585 [Vicinamibacterales bacterium]|jgi:hypothetical protein|nr:hypothetical protein [Vicinamibacterales bacterium]
MSKRVFAAVLVGAFLVPINAAGQQAPAEPGPSAKTAAAPPAHNAHDPVNIRLDLTISSTDPKSSAPLSSKVATLHVVDRDNGRIRMVAGNPARDSAHASGILNVDAAPVIVARDRVRVTLSLEFRSAPEGQEATALSVNERVVASLESGKALVVSQTTDPTSDRQVRVELKATILK